MSHASADSEVSIGKDHMRCVGAGWGTECAARTGSRLRVLARRSPCRPAPMPFWDTRRPGTRFAVPERVLVFRGGNRRSRAGGEASQNGIGASWHGERRASTRSFDPVHAVAQDGSGCPETAPSVRPTRAGRTQRVEARKAHGHRAYRVVGPRLVGRARLCSDALALLRGERHTSHEGGRP